MKLRELLKKLRLRPLSGEGERPVDNVDALTTALGPHGDIGGSSNVPAMAPPNWVPSQQDERPPH